VISEESDRDQATITKPNENANDEITNEASTTASTTAVVLPEEVNNDEAEGCGDIFCLLTCKDFKREKCKHCNKEHSEYCLWKCGKENSDYECSSCALFNDNIVSCCAKSYCNSINCELIIF